MRKKPMAYAPRMNVGESREDSSISLSDLDYMYVQYTCKNRMYEIYVVPQVVRQFWQEYGIDLEYDTDLKIFRALLKELPKKGSFIFIPFDNNPIASKVLSDAKSVRDQLAAIDAQMERLKEQHEMIKKKAIDLVLKNGISTMKGRIYHKKMLTGNWIMQLRQLLPDLALKTPNVPEVEELIENFPKHKKKLQKLLDHRTQRYEVEITESSVYDALKTLKDHDVSDLKLSFKSKSTIDDDELPNSFSWDDMDLDFEKAEKVIDSLPFEIKLELFDLPEIEDSHIQFHYKTDQKTDPDCMYCGDDFIKNTNTCSTCGLTSFKVVPSKKPVVKKTTKKRSKSNTK